MSTGVILLADIIPSLIIKLLCPFLPFFIKWVNLFIVFSSSFSFLRFSMEIWLDDNINVMPFIPFHSVRVFLACFMQCCGFLMVAFANSEWMAITGVIFTSASSGLGEASLLSYSSRFHKLDKPNKRLPLCKSCGQNLIFIFTNRKIGTWYRRGVQARAVLALLAHLRTQFCVRWALDRLIPCW